jgi:arabinose-5-phosphate isomerase
MAMGDAVAMALLDRRGLRPEDYAALHPGGTLAWRALFRVADLMHTGDAVPLVPEAAGLRDVVLEMTRGRLGMTAVVDEAGRLAGVLTDGDLRRLHVQEADLAALTAREGGSRHPKVIAPDDLAAKALEVMEAFAITSLIIVDHDRRPSGVIHMHDILRAKIV